MRTLGLIMVFMGALALGVGEFTVSLPHPSSPTLTAQRARERKQTVWVPPVVGGITITLGAILIATGNKQHQV